MTSNKTSKQLVIAKASHVLSSPRKTNLVLKAIVGRHATQAVRELALVPKRAAEPIIQLIKQAIGNAVSQFQASPDSLIIDSAFATKGRVLKRAHIGGRGKTKPYERTTSHLTLNVRIPAPKVALPKAPVKSAEPSPVIARSEGDVAIQKSKKSVTTKKVVKTKITK
jgi:large subunit ribosomal protein L22